MCIRDSVSIDGGPFIPVGATLQTRVRPGIHLVRVKKQEGGNELSINGFEGENKEVAATVQMDVTDPTKPPPDKVAINNPPPEIKNSTPPPAEPAEHVEAWLQTGTQYGSDNGRAR